MGMHVNKSRFIKRKQAITDLIESIALEEDAIAHILDAEGKALGAVVCQERFRPELLLAVNKSVTDVIKSVTRLEYFLECKLDLFKNCLCEERCRDCNDYDDDYENFDLLEEDEK